jgi:Phosphotriesterase family
MIEMQRGFLGPGTALEVPPGRAIIPDLLQPAHLAIGRRRFAPLRTAAEVVAEIQVNPFQDAEIDCRCARATDELRADRRGGLHEPARLLVGQCGDGGRGSVPSHLIAEVEGSRVVTVRGPIAPEQMGRTLPHEPILVDFIGAARVSRDRYDAGEVFRAALPHLRRIRDQGIGTLVECTPAYLGRDVTLLRRLAEASGLHLVTNTGSYGANGGQHLPEHARTESADELAARWLREWREGIEGSGIRPGFIKIGTDAGPLPEVNRKLVRAAARSHLASGLTIAAHTGDGTAAMQELEILREEGVAPSAFIWVHAQNEPDTA